MIDADLPAVNDLEFTPAQGTDFNNHFLVFHRRTKAMAPPIKNMVPMAATIPNIKPPGSLESVSGSPAES
jgi:hypothetical protein